MGASPRRVLSNARTVAKGELQAGLWKRDGTEAGTTLVAAGVFPSQIVDVNGTAFFLASDPTHGTELWQSNGTAAGTVLVRDIWPGPASGIAYDASLYPLNGTLYFPANDGIHGTELWSATATPANLPGQFQFSAAGYAVNENGGSAVITVSRSGGSSGTVTVHYATADGTATAGSDYTATSGTLTFADGETSKTFSVPITKDVLIEPDETVSLQLAAPTGGASLGTPSTATLTIHDTTALVQFSAASYTAAENGGEAVITVVRLGNTAGTAIVQYATGGGTAAPGTDYTPVSGTLMFNPGETSKTISVPVVNDTLIEGDQTVGLVLRAPSDAYLGSQSSAVLTIQDTSTPPPAIPLAGDVTARVSIGRPRVKASARAKKAMIVVINMSGQVLAGPLVLALDRLPKGIKLRSAPGFQLQSPKRGNPYVILSAGQFGPGQQVSITLNFNNPTGRVPRFTPRLVVGFTGV
jgi:ELWxxDGT repeat protein